MTTPTQLVLDQTLDLLTQAGFVPDGHTQQQTVRMATTASPVLGRSGGTLAQTGGRQRFAKPGTNLKATVGKQTTSLYRVIGQGTVKIQVIAAHDTKNLEATRLALQSL